ncbi:hypothetical protein CARUB_v10007011mg [Capsella rubella]|uniref:TF-B3 domain-containing protein n=2 Tax=Capsella rubella TaxID=81985 RepID=R0H1H4_9BRAS|nr:hypothetical protein CARUB_v10007011mg [Capsella rubella]
MDSGKDMWSDFCLLVDAAVMIEEEEHQQRLRLLEKKREEEEESSKRFFYVFPRKPRSSLVKRRYTQQQNPNGVSSTTSTSSLTDYETRRNTTRNPSFDERMVYDAEVRAKKGKSKIVCEDYDYGESDEEKRLFEKNMKRFVRNLRRNFGNNLDGSSSTSSSFLNLRFYEPSLLLGYNTTNETKELPNPCYQSSSPSSCVTENTSRKRRAVQERKSGKFKKAKVAFSPRRMDTEAPDWIFQVMRRMKADDERPMLIFQRGLTASDVTSGQSRLLIPFQQLIRNDFLTPGESQAMEKDENNEIEDENIGVGTILVNQRCEKWGLRFKIWAMEKDTGHGTLNYALNWGWNDVVKGNHLKAKDKISLWTFRWRGVLCFALERY